MLRKLLPLLLLLAIVVFAHQVMTSGYERITVPKENDVLNSYPNRKMERNKAEIEKTIRTFVPIYYERNSSLLQGETAEVDQRFAERLRPYVTASFLQSSLPLLGIPQNDPYKQPGFSLEGAVTDWEVVGGTVERASATRYAEVTVSVVENGRTIQRTRSVIEFFLKKEDGRWLVHECTCDG